MNTRYINNISNIQQMLSVVKYRFKNELLLQEALMHRSAIAQTTSEDDSHGISNERLEFLGDAVLSLALSGALLTHSERFQEGELSQIRSALVNEQALAQIAKTIGLDACIFLSNNEEQSGGRQKPSLLADAVEALLGAIFLDAGFDKTQAIILNLYKPLITDSLRILLAKDYKSRLQELIQNRCKDRPSYIVIDQAGPEHKKEFSVQVSYGAKILGEGTGMSKKQASQQAAQQALNNLRKNPELLNDAHF